MDLIYHITTPAAWQGANEIGVLQAASLSTEGFIHCSRQRQLLAVASHFFSVDDDLLVLAIDAAALGATLVNEGPAGVGDPFAANVFPHVYAPIPVGAVVATARLACDDAGRYQWPPELPQV